MLVRPHIKMFNTPFTGKPTPNFRNFITCIIMSSAAPVTKFTERLKIKNAAQLVLVCANREKVLKGTAMQNIATLQASGDQGLTIVVDREGNIAAVGYNNEVDAAFPNYSFEKEIDATGLCVLPGLVDAHTHPVWVGDRVHEFAMKVGSQW